MNKFSSNLSDKQFDPKPSIMENNSKSAHLESDVKIYTPEEHKPKD